MGDEFFVGRADELARLADLLAAVAAGVGRAVLVEGEQGVGKTSLLRRALGSAEREGCALAWGAGDELAQRSPLWLMRQCLAAGGRVVAGADDEGSLNGPAARSAGRIPVVAGLVPPGDPVAAETERLLALVDRWCAVSPVVLVAEDLQWADDASLLMWQQLARVVGQVPLLLVGSVRPGPGTGEVDRLRRGLLSRGQTVMPLGPLGPREVSELAGRLAGGRPGQRLAAAVRSAAGNPLYARELVDALVRDGRVLVEAGVAELAGPRGARVPTSLTGVIEQRLAALPQETAEVLRWAAVLGQEFSAVDLAVVAGLTAEQLVGVIADAVTAEVVGEARPGPAGTGIMTGPGLAGAGRVGQARRLAFRHGLIRQVLYDGLAGSLRAELHEQAARALAGAGAAPERIAVQLAVVPEWSDRWVLDAAPVLTYQAPSVAAELLERGLSLLPDGDERRETLEAALVTVALLLVRDEQAERVGVRLASYARDPGRAAEAAWRVGYAQMRTARPSDAVASVERALQRPGVGDVWTARLRALRALAMSFASRLDTPQAARDALALAEAAHDRLAAGYALFTMYLVDIYLRRHEAALRHSQRALEVIGDDPEATDLVVLLLSLRVQVLHELDRCGEARTTVSEALALAERTGSLRLWGTACLVAAEYHFKAGEWDDALALLQQALSSPSSGMKLAHGLIALIAGHRDDPVMAEHLAAAEIQEIGRSSFQQGTWHFVLLAQALAAEKAAGPAEAVAVLRPDIDPVGARGMMYRYVFFPDLVRLALAAEDAAAASAAAQAAAEEAEREPLPVKAAASDHCRGLVEGDPAPVLAAAAYYQSASRPLEHAQSLEDAAVLLARGGDLAAARRAAAQAAQIYQGLGARWDVRRSRARLSSYGIRPAARRTRPLRGWEALTPTEVKVARLIGDGLSNPDVAAELFLSRNTVQTHVSRILAKLSASSRSEIVLEAFRHPAVPEKTKSA
jgi:DNA-binding CsgD family transcriptional regulator/tetratricopeptide (TPR) repeat protein